MINCVGEIWYYDKLSSEIVSKSFNTAGITLIQDGSEEMFICNSPFQEDNQFMVKQVEQPEMNRMKDEKTDDYNNNFEEEYEEEYEEDDEKEKEVVG